MGFQFLRRKCFDGELWRGNRRMKRKREDKSNKMSKRERNTEEAQDRMKWITFSRYLLHRQVHKRKDKTHRHQTFAYAHVLRLLVSILCCPFHCLVCTHHDLFGTLQPRSSSTSFDFSLPFGHQL